MEMILCHLPDEGLPFSLAPGIRSEQSKRRLLWNVSVGVEDLCGRALWTNKILCYGKPLRSKRRLSPNHVLSRSYLIICNLSNFCCGNTDSRKYIRLTNISILKEKNKTLMIPKIIFCHFIAQRSIQQSSTRESAFSAVVWFTYSTSSWPAVRYSYNDAQEVSILRKFMWYKMSNFLKPWEGDLYCFHS